MCFFFLANNLVPDKIAIARDIASATKVPKDFLAKIMQKLIGGGIVRSIRGASGGFWLARPAKEITPYDVVCAMDGPLHMNKCVMDGKECGIIQGCPLPPVWSDLHQMIRDKLGSINFEELTLAYHKHTKP